MPSMIWGPLRLLAFLLLVYIINLISLKKATARSPLDYFMLRYSFFISALVLASLFLTQVDSYDLFVILLILIILAVLGFLNLKPKRSLKRQFRKIRRRSILYVIKSVEYGERLVSAKNFKTVKRTTNAQQIATDAARWHTRPSNHLWIAVCLGVLAFASRYYFFLFDTYLLSDLWYQNLAQLKDLSLQHWFFHSGTMMGEMAVINFYSDITGITDAAALTSFGLIESALLTVSIFWTVNKLMGKTIAGAVIAALSFIFLYTLLPLNIDLITQPKAAFLAMSIALPYLVYLVVPQQAPLRFKSQFLGFFVIVLTLLFIDLFVAFIVLPTAIIVSGLYYWKSQRKKVYNSLLSYAAAIAIGMIVLGIASVVQGNSLSSYLFSNLFSYSNYTYAPQLLLPLDQLWVAYQVAASIFVLLAHGLFILNRFYKSVAILSTLMWVLFLLPLLRFPFVDPDVLNHVLSVFSPILIAGILYSSYFLLVRSMAKDPFQWATKVTLSTLAVLLVLASTIGNIPSQYPRKNPVNADIIKVNDKMKTELLPYSYVLVHNDKNSRLGEQRHYFLDYLAFNQDYLKKDLAYQNYKTNINYLRSHPDVVLPQSTFIFTYNTASIANEKNELNADEQQRAAQIIEILRERGREINIYFRTPRVTVYEIVNQPKAARITDLLI